MFARGGYAVNGFPERVLLVTNGLESTALAARVAVDLAKGAELHVVHVWHKVPTAHYGRFVRSGLQDAGREALDAQVRRIEEGGTVAGAQLREGHAVEIVAQAEEIGAGLVVVGSWGKAPNHCLPSVS